MTTPFRFSSKTLDDETGFYYFGARYLNPKTSMWISADPAMGKYVPRTPIDDEARKHNQKLPGMGGVFNYVNFHVYHYANNNPVKYIDPNGEAGISALLSWLPAIDGPVPIGDIIYAVAVLYDIFTTLEPLRQD